MAIGDIIADVVSISATSSVNFQPAAGVEIIITGVGHTNSPAALDLILVIDNSTNTTIIYANPDANITGTTILKYGITNGDFLKLQNLSAGTEEMSYTGVQTS